MPNTNHFDTLAKGQCYDEVCAVLGEPTTLISSETAQIEPGIVGGAVQSELYEWCYDNGDVIRILFKQGALNDKVFFPHDNE